MQPPAQIPRDPERGHPSAPRRESSQEEKQRPSHDYAKSAGGSERTLRVERDTSGESPHDPRHSDGDHNQGKREKFCVHYVGPGDDKKRCDYYLCNLASPASQLVCSHWPSRSEQQVKIHTRDGQDCDEFFFFMR